MPIEDAASTALITNDAVVLGLLAVILGAVFWASSRQSVWVQRFFTVIPALLLCYFLPSLLTTFGVVDPEESRLYYIASRYLLPAALVLLTVSADLPAVFGLGPKALIMFLTGTVGVMIGGPVALLLTGWIAPELMGAGPEAIWRGMATVAGSWIGGSANQTALYEIYGAAPTPSPSGSPSTSSSACSTSCSGPTPPPSTGCATRPKPMRPSTPAFPCSRI